jgi:hypothetical protein
MGWRCGGARWVVNDETRGLFTALASLGFTGSLPRDPDKSPWLQDGRDHLTVTGRFPYASGGSPLVPVLRTHTWI